MTIGQEPLSLEDLLELPEEEPALEYIDGAVSQKVAPGGHHSVLQGELVQRLDQAGQRANTARAFLELRTSFASASLVPDVSVYCRERIRRDERGRVADDFWQPPDIAIEIVSPEQSVTTLVRRCLWCVANGVRIALLVDPADESVLALRPGQPPLAWHGKEEIDLSEVLPDFELRVDELFASLLLE